MRHAVVACLAALSTLACALPALAQPAPAPIPTWRVLYRNLLIARYNPIGLLDEGAVLARHRLYRHDSAALRDNFVGLGPIVAASPAFLRVGGLVEAQPLSILHLWAAFEGVQWFGAAGHLQSLATAAEAYDDETLKLRRELPDADPKAPHAVAGTVASAGGTLQVKVGPIAARLLGKWMRFDLDLPLGRAWAYDPTYDVVAPRAGVVRTLDADLLWQSADRSRTVGLRATQGTSETELACTTGSAPACDLTPPEPILRAGPLVAWRLWQREGGSTGTVIGLAQWWLQHRYRTGQVSAQAVPYLALGIHVTGDWLAAE